MFVFLLLRNFVHFFQSLAGSDNVLLDVHIYYAGSITPQFASKRSVRARCLFFELGVT